MSDEVSVKVLGEMLKTEKEPDVKRMLVYSLGETESDEAVPILLDLAMNDKDNRVRAAAVSALGEIGSPKARDALLKVLEKK
jgi:HEAT repeat protein